MSFFKLLENFAMRDEDRSAKVMIYSLRLDLDYFDEYDKSLSP
jgi:hypothetical protein